MKFKSLFPLLVLSIINTINFCTSDSKEEQVTTVTAPTTSATTAPSVNLNNYSYSASEIQLMDLVNAYRVSIGLKALVKTNYISSKALEHNNYMLTTNVLSHDHFNTRSKALMNTLNAKLVGENVAYNKSTPQAAFDAWLASSGHKANIVGAYTNFGISIRVGADGRKYYTNIFANI